jgi:predicted lipoprotein with Yx(FWY)xxD motif
MSLRTMSRRVLLVTGAIVAAISGLALASSPTTSIHLGSTSYGPYVAQRLQNGQHDPIYISTHDLRDKSRCFGSCTLTFQPVIAHGRVKAFNGVRQKLLGVINRGHGVKQVTYNHHPLYTSSGDSAGMALDDGCMLFGGRWYVLGRNGIPDKRWNWNCGPGGY